MESKPINGGEFLIKETGAEDIFIPEQFTEEQKMMARACQEFIDTDIFPQSDLIDSMEDPELVPQILRKAGELGLLGLSVPEVYGGMGMSFNTSMLIADIVGCAGSFSTTYGAHTGIGTLPILYYGTEEQKNKYLPKLVTAEWAACYCLTEPEAGSDANSGKSKAVLSQDGSHYLLNGQKMWITNAGFAEVMIVFAKIEDDKNLSAFIVERKFGGISMNEEEKKMGIKGSSTRQVFFNDCPVPVENLLSTRGNGFKIAVNILNIGRVKLGVGVLGGCRRVLGLAIKYSIERKQFGSSISTFGAIKYKLAEMAIRTFASESLCYRAGQDIEDRIDALIAGGTEVNQAKLKGLEEFAIECAIAKVHGSEVLDYVVDEGVQVYGGMGYSAEVPMEKAYRDARISRIYEGTNEINRILMAGILLKRAAKGEIDLFSQAKAVAKELMSVPDFGTDESSDPLHVEKELLKGLKKVFLMVCGKAADSFKEKIEEEQELMMNLADMMIEIYAAESAILRAEKLMSLADASGKISLAMARVYLYDAVDKISKAAKDAIAAFTSGDEQKIMLMGMRRFTKTDLLDTKALRREIADAVIAEEKYPSFY